jgi:hypothetical protein
MRFRLDRERVETEAVPVRIWQQKIAKVACNAFMKKLKRDCFAIRAPDMSMIVIHATDLAVGKQHTF